jgi:cytidylate kinase
MRIMLSSPMPGCGKDTIADYLVEKYNYTKISFAGPIYTIAKNYFNMTSKDRVLLQSIGQGFRSLDKKVWIKEMEKRVN